MAVHPHAKHTGRFTQAQLHIARRAGVGACADGVFVVVQHGQRQAQRGDKGVNRAVALAVQRIRFALAAQGDAQPGAAIVVVLLVAGVGIRGVDVQVFGAEQSVQRGGVHLAASRVAVGLHHPAEFNLQPARQGQAIGLLQQITHSALARLAVDPNHRVVAAPHVGRVYRQIGHRPRLVGVLLGKTLLDGVLMRTRKRRIHQIAGIRVARVHGQLGAVLDHRAHAVDVRKIQPRRHALRIQIHRQGEQVHIAGALAMAKQTALHPLGAGHHRQLGRRHRRATVVVRVHAENQAVAARQMAVHPFDLVGVGVGGGQLHRSRQVDDHLVLRRRLPHCADRIADFQGEFRLAGGEGFWRVFKHPLGVRATRGQGANLLGAAHRQRLDASAVAIEHNAAKRRGDRVVQMDNGAARAMQRLNGAGNQILARLRQHAQRHIRRHGVLFDQLADKIKIGLRGRWKRHFDFPEANLHQQGKQLPLARRRHRLDQRLIAVAQVGAQPDGRRAGDLVGPLPVGQGQRDKSRVFVLGLAQH